MSGSSLWPLLGRLHPALVHAPIGAALFLPLALGLALRDRPGGPWLRTGCFLAVLGLLGGLAAMVSGYGFAQALGGIAPGAWLAHALRPEPSFPALLRHHQLLALAGLPAGAGCGLCLGRALRGGRGALRAACGLSLLWLALWGAAGHWGGRMVYRDPPGDGSMP
jgi:uncharacterized membrane protein